MIPLVRRPPTRPVEEFQGPLISRGPAGDCCVLCGRVGTDLSDEHGCTPDVELQEVERFYHRRELQLDEQGRYLWPERNLPRQESGEFRPVGPMTTKALAGLLRTVATAQEGTRNGTLNWAAWKVAQAGYGAEAADALAEAARTAGLSDREIRATLRSAGCRS